MNKLNNKVAVVTGGSSGIGFTGSDLTEDFSTSGELESWTVEELADVVPSCGELGASEVEMYWDHSASLEQVDMYFG